MSKSIDAHGVITRRSMLGAVGSAAGVAVFAGPAATVGARLAQAGSSARFVRELGSPDLYLPSPGNVWADFECGPISISLLATGRFVQISARVPVDYGGPDGTGFGVSFAEDGVNLHRDDQQGFAYARINGSTVVSSILDASTMRQVLPGLHTWTLRVRHENPLSGPEVQRTYCRTRRIAPLEFTAVEL